MFWQQDTLRFGNRDGLSPHWQVTHFGVPSMQAEGVPVASIFKSTDDDLLCPPSSKLELRHVENTKITPPVRCFTAASTWKRDCWSRQRCRIEGHITAGASSEAAQVNTSRAPHSLFDIVPSVSLLPAVVSRESEMLTSHPYPRHRRTRLFSTGMCWTCFSRSGTIAVVCILEGWIMST